MKIPAVKFKIDRNFAQEDERLRGFSRQSLN